MRVLFLLALCFAAAVAWPGSSESSSESSSEDSSSEGSSSEGSSSEDSSEGSRLNAKISQYPFVASLQYSSGWNIYRQKCSGTILTESSVLTVASCLDRKSTKRMRVRVGSEFANRGGSTYRVKSITNHQHYNHITYDNDIAIIRTTKKIKFAANKVVVASIASPDYYLADNVVVWSMGWADNSDKRPKKQLYDVKIWSVNQQFCRKRYANRKELVTDNMLCAGWREYEHQDECPNNIGSPLLHNNIVMGISSWGGTECGNPRYPIVHTRVSRYTSWIRAHSY